MIFTFNRHFLLYCTSWQNHNHFISILKFFTFRLGKYRFQTKLLSLFYLFSFSESRFSLFCLHLSAQSLFSYSILPYPHTCASQLPAEVPPDVCPPCPARSLPLRYLRPSQLSDTLTALCVPPTCPDRSARTIQELISPDTEYAVIAKHLLQTCTGSKDQVIPCLMSQCVIHTF